MQKRNFLMKSQFLLLFGCEQQKLTPQFGSILLVSCLTLSDVIASLLNICPPCVCVCSDKRTCRTTIITPTRRHSKISIVVNLFCLVMILLTIFFAAPPFFLFSSFQALRQELFHSPFRVHMASYTLKIITHNWLLLPPFTVDAETIEDFDSPSILSVQTVFIEHLSSWISRAQRVTHEIGNDEAQPLEMESRFCKNYQKITANVTFWCS